MSLVSIIVPVYNAAPYLTDCVNSILSQSFQDFELLLVDDGSTDESPKICDELAVSDSRIRVFHKKNGGVSSARNKGLEESCGQWIYFCDADDEMLFAGLDTMISLTHEVEMVMAGYLVYNDEGKCINCCPERNVETLNQQESLVQMLAPSYYYYQGYLWNKLFLREEIEHNHLRFDASIKCNEDRLFITQFLVRTSGRCNYTTTPVYHYNFRESGSMLTALNSKKTFSLETDLIASILMADEVKKLKNDALIDLYRQGIFVSFKFVSENIARINALTSIVRIRLVARLIFGVGFRYWYLWKCGRYIIKIKH